MGLSIGKRCFNSPNLNPDPDHWVLEESYTANGYTAIRCKYTNIPVDRFERFKIIVLEGDVPVGPLDPHFSEKGKIVARFKPTGEGWKHAVNFVNSNPMVGHGQSVITMNSGSIVP